MKLSHAFVLAAGIVLAGLLIAGSNLLFSRYEYIYAPNGDLLFRLDKGTGGVERYNAQQRVWVSQW